MDDNDAHRSSAGDNVGIASNPVARADAAIRTEEDKDQPLYNCVPRHWGLMAPVLVGLGGLMGLISWSLPGWLASTCMLAASLLCLVAPHFQGYERQVHERTGIRYVMLVPSVALPMFLFGFGAAAWTNLAGSLDWEVTTSVLVLLVLIASSFLERRMVAVAATTLALWSGSAVFVGSAKSLAILALGAVIGGIVVARRLRSATDATLLRAQLEREQRRAEQFVADCEESGQGWFWETDRASRITYVSARIAGQLNRTLEDLVGRPFVGLFQLDAQDQEGERTLVFHLSTRSSFHDLSVRAASEREERWWSISGRPVLDQFNNFMGFRGTGTDLTEKRRSQQHVTQLARYDVLTKLANRFQMSEWLEKVLSAPRLESRTCAVFLLDLDRFKQVNDTLGHPTGDALLQQVAERLAATVGERGRVGRLGGDEFQIILHGPQNREGLAHLARRIIDTLSQPYSIDGARVSIGASVGIALCPDDGHTSEEIIRNADLALYAAKGRGRGRHHFYDDDLHADAKERQQLEQDLRDAIASGSLELHYQPQVRTDTEEIIGFEALLRWKHPVHGYMSPARFVPVAEETGLVAQVGEWALRTACQDLAQWPGNVRVAVNVSPLQFANPALPAIVTSAIAAAGIEASRLELEITESVFLGDDRSTEAMFAALKGLGVRLALDDFGTGYSSLGYLKKAPFDKIKIDQSFLRGAIVPGSRNGAIISSIVSLADALGMETTAEGVETLDELDLVRSLGCSHVQGYIYERPLSRGKTVALLSAGTKVVAQGPRSARAPRQTMLRKVRLEHGGHRYAGTIRNISQNGAMIEGLWNVPTGTVFDVYLADGLVMPATSRWCKEDRMGVEFAQPLDVDRTGAVQFTPPRGRRERQSATALLRTG